MRPIAAGGDRQKSASSGISSLVKLITITYGFGFEFKNAWLTAIRKRDLDTSGVSTYLKFPRYATRTVRLSIFSFSNIRTT